jgi:sulfate permease, SulP family
MADLCPMPRRRPPSLAYRGRIARSLESIVKLTAGFDAINAFQRLRNRTPRPTPLLAIITAQHGIAGLQIATLMAGMILLAFGFARLGAVIKYIPNPVIAGFTAGIGVIIFVGQWKDFFGLSPAPAGPHFHEKLISLIEAWSTINPATTGLGLMALAILILGARFLKRIPAPLVALVVVTGVQAIGQFKGVATIGSAFGGIPRSLPSFSFPSVTFTQVISLIGPAFTIALLGAIESLLSAVVSDGMAGARHDSNQELIGQGIANIAAPLFGGFAATGAIARTATNIRNGATSPLAGIVHSLVLVSVILLLAPLASAIPPHVSFDGIRRPRRGSQRGRHSGRPALYATDVGRREH